MSLPTSPSTPPTLSALSAAQLSSLLTCQGIKHTQKSTPEELLAVCTSNADKLANLNLVPIRNKIAALMESDRMHDDGSFGPLFLRLAWHCSGTYTKATNTGGSNGGLMRFEKSADPENSGLTKATDLLESIKAEFDFMSHADIYILAGCVAIEAMGGPFIPFRYGRVDFDEAAATEKYGMSKCPFGHGTATNPSGSLLPAADLGPVPNAPKGCPMSISEKPTIDGIRGVFSRMGFDDKQTVNLIVLGHQFGRCHLDVSGYEHPWYVFDPAHWNVYDHGLGYMSIYEFGVANGQHEERVTEKGKRQWELSFGGGEPFMMLPSDMALWWDENYRQYVQFYDRKRLEFKRDAVVNFVQLVELGCDGLLTEEKPVRGGERRSFDRYR
jgi:cytochrome c peroxidase